MIRFLLPAYISLIFISDVQTQQVIHKEILGKPTDKGITIRLFFSDAVEALAQYGIKTNELNQQTAWIQSSTDNSVTIPLEGLTPDTKYYYRVGYRNLNTNEVLYRPVYTFHTQRNEDKTFTFVIQADPHLDEMSDTALYRRCLRNQLEEGADFMVDLGDIIMTDKLKGNDGKITRDTIVKRCQYMREYYTTACHSLPLFIALGNHEGEAGWQLVNNGENIAVWNTLERKKYFTNPQPNSFYSGDETNHDYTGLRENYYSWTWGDALFIVLDPYWYTTTKPGVNTGWNWTLGKKQYDWLKSVLENNTSTYKFLFSHQLIGGDPMGRGGIEFAQWYEWGGYNKDGSYGFDTQRPGWGKPIKDILTDNKVSIFFHGHDHFFGKQEKDCLVYQECPQPSLPNFTAANQADDYGYLSGLILPNAGHLRVTVSPEETKVEYVRAYLPQNENANRKNKDVSATYYIKKSSCYDTLSTSISPVIWNARYKKEIVYPNPYTDHTVIKFSLDHSDKISILIYDLKGHLVRTLINQNVIIPGEFEIFFDGNSDNGIPLTSGIYLYKINGVSRDYGAGQFIKI